MLVWLPTLATALVYGALVFVALRAYGWQPSVFAQVGELFVDRAALPANVVVLPGGGYDGQLYLRLANEPFTSQVDAHGIRLDGPSSRQGRVLYPLLAWAASFGQPQWTPVAMIAVNFIALLMLTWAAGALAVSAGLARWWGLAIALYPGHLFTVLRDLTDVVALTASLLSLLALRRGRFGWATAALAAAVLARETTMVVVAAVAAVWAWERIRGRRHFAAPWTTFAIPTAVFLGWQLFMAYRWGGLPVGRLAGVVAPPFAPIGQLAQRVAGLTSADDWRMALELGWLALFTIGVLICLRTSSAPMVERLAFVLIAAAAPFVGSDVWVHDIGFMRSLSDFQAYGCLVLFGASAWARAPLVAGSFGLWLLLYVQSWQVQM